MRKSVVGIVSPRFVVAIASALVALVLTLIAPTAMAQGATPAVPATPPTPALPDIASAQIEIARLQGFALQARRGDEEAFASLAAARTRIGAVIDALKREHAERAGISRIVASWAHVTGALDTIAEKRADVVAARAAGEQFIATLMQQQAAAEEIARAIADAPGTSHDVYLATRQLTLLTRMTLQATRILDGPGIAALTAGDSLGRDAQMYRKVYEAMRDGDTDLGIAKAPAVALPLIEQLLPTWEAAADSAMPLLEGVDGIGSIDEAASALALDADSLIDDLNAVKRGR